MPRTGLRRTQKIQPQSHTRHEEIKRQISFFFVSLCLGGSLSFAVNVYLSNTLRCEEEQP